jgi:diguanylate cyclase (GGDEF)-like protein/PAS domain S-box-containing protein
MKTTKLPGTIGTGSGKPASPGNADQMFAVLASQPGTTFFALGSDGLGVPVPAHPELAGLLQLPVLPAQASMLERILPEDQPGAIAAWGLACQAGTAETTVRFLSEPARPLSLRIMDLRHRFGVLLGALIPRSPSVPGVPDLADTLWAAPARPRTALLQASPFAMIRQIDERTTQMLGWQPDQMVGTQSMEFYHPEDRTGAVASWMQLISTGRRQRTRLRHKCSDGTWCWVEREISYAEPDPARPDDQQVQVQLSDISDEMDAYEMYRRLAESIPVGLIQIDPGYNITYTNTRISEILGLIPSQRLQRLNQLVPSRDLPQLTAALKAAFHTKQDQQIEITIRRASNGETRRCACTVVCLTGTKGQPGAIICVNDITESATLHEQLQQQATHDALTGCYNRAATMAVLDSLLAVHQPAGVIFIDLDQFKAVNDQHGHAAGDQLLAIVARRLAGCVRSGDIVGRLGGDEFLVICRQTGKRDGTLRIVRRIAAALAEPVIIDAGQVSAQASVGVCRCHGKQTADQVIACADAAMYRSKRQGAHRPVLCQAPASPDSNGPPAELAAS